MTIRAIETRYNGYRFRSRLEARWAVFFDVLGLEWLYEHEGFDLGQLGRYLPDFWFPSLDCFGEVKPTTLSEDEFSKCQALPKPCLLLDGYPAVARGYFCTGVWDGDRFADYSYYESGEAYGRIMIPCSKSEGRLWFLFGESPDDYCIDAIAETAAKSARFEHGENGLWLPRKTWPGLDALDYATTQVAEMAW